MIDHTGGDRRVADKQRITSVSHSFKMISAAMLPLPHRPNWGLTSACTTLNELGVAQLQPNWIGVEIGIGIVKPMFDTESDIDDPGMRSLPVGQGFAA